ncbi:phosphomevalonate kinase [Candidatus Woesearchaeota archaeon]|nr:phosphomevalonate kinase [Candidatus Woesearchaeota archaeon]
MITKSSPGKLFISGEWSVLEGNPAIVAAIDSRTTVTIKKSKDNLFHIHLKDYGLKVDFRLVQGNFSYIQKLSKKKIKKFRFMKNAVEICCKYFSGLAPFSIETRNDRKGKFGFGTSASATASIISAIAGYEKQDISKIELYKLSAVSHFISQGKKGSGADISASVYGGVVLYYPYDSGWLKHEINKSDLKNLIKKEWPGLKLTRLIWPDDYFLSVGWTKKASSTTQMIKKIMLFKKNHTSEYKRIIKKISGTTIGLSDAIDSDDKPAVLKFIRKTEAFLRELGILSGVDIETQELKNLTEIADRHGGAGKLSGAGGGDCGIAVCFDRITKDKIEKNWIDSGIVPFDVGIY